jgi:ABC-type uncharacterized transport system fused permease/ATPase subunit
MIVGFGFLRAITPNLGALTSKEQALEGAFRFLHSRLRTHAESVAFFGGGDREKSMVQVRDGTCRGRRGSWLELG